jgi:hypothetical protein
MLFVGDSIGQSIATEFSAIVSPAYPSVNFQALANRCMVGPSCVTPDKGLPDAIGVVNSLSAEQFPQIAIVQLGYNDDPNTMAGDVAAVINALNARNVQRIVFVNLSTRRASQNYALSNAALTSAAQTNPNVSVLDWNAASSDPSASRWFSDDVHLTATGRAEFTLFLRACLAIASRFKYGSRFEKETETLDRWQLWQRHRRRCKQNRRTEWTSSGRPCRCNCAQSAWP